jgi:hypothetical protein
MYAYATAPSHNPYPAQPQMMPYGIIGDTLQAIGGPAGRVIGGHWGHADLGQQTGNTLGNLAGTFLPFNAMPQPQQEMAPFFVGNLLSKVAPIAGGLAGRALGNEQAGRMAGNVAGQLARLLPFNAAPQAYSPQPYAVQPYAAAPYAEQPQMTPYGIVGDALQAVGGPAGGVIGGIWGHGDLGQKIGSTFGNLAGTFLPFNAMPEPYAAQPYNVPLAQPQIAPYGIVGDTLQTIGGPAGRVIGGHWGHADLGQQIGNTLGNFAGTFLPFNAMPQQQQEMAPFFVGNLLSKAAPIAGGLAGRALGNEQAGRMAGNVAGQLARLLPFNAAPQAYSPQPYAVQPYAAAPYAEQPQMAPYGIIGTGLGLAAPHIGGAIGRAFGNESMGRTVGSIAGIASNFLPFSVGPGQVAYLPVETGMVH